MSDAMVRMNRGDLLAEATTIAEEYRDKDLSLTLRQLYYQCVARALIPNSQESYKRLGDTLGNARLKGDFEMDLLIDRGREAKASSHKDCKVNVRTALSEARGYVRSIPRWTIAVDRWFGQRTHVSVWVEKEALAGVFDRPCEELGVGLFACKGYPSHSALWQWMTHLHESYEASNEWRDTDTDDDAHPYERQRPIR